MGGSSHWLLCGSLLLLAADPVDLFERFFVEARLFWNQALTVLTSLPTQRTNQTPIMTQQQNRL